MTVAERYQAQGGGALTFCGWVRLPPEATRRRMLADVLACCSLPPVHSGELPPTKVSWSWRPGEGPRTGAKGSGRGYSSTVGDDRPKQGTYRYFNPTMSVSMRLIQGNLSTILPDPSAFQRGADSMMMSHEVIGNVRAVY
ncbi:hypothetical protein BBK36DRAFT_1173596 [Trichoderma citrinoviride]|uniref:Uncharacterized protein n=1 Tax=Trichoderma citrinoviride TaxID=58853 RepID=A0A2T4BLN0_9HYPO|nr:hypothetical protein BBK36DRAFT_1173596 [Trichoderma citrinoviride]PTB70228.1 hypothetical protein BBK36DRAFT_1173596 [Trichoderma citrinoviride]